MQEDCSCKIVWNFVSKLFDIKSIDNPWEIVVTVNPKQNYEHFEDFRCNKKHKGTKQGSPSINFDNFAKRILSVNKIKNFENPKYQYHDQQRFSVIRGKMQKNSILKTNLLFDFICLT